MEAATTTAATGFLPEIRGAGLGEVGGWEDLPGEN